jgi:hypothetical protein
MCTHVDFGREVQAKEMGLIQADTETETETETVADTDAAAVLEADPKPGISENAQAGAAQLPSAQDVRSDFDGNGVLEAQDRIENMAVAGERDEVEGDAGESTEVGRVHALHDCQDEQHPHDVEARTSGDRDVGGRGGTLERKAGGGREAGAELEQGGCKGAGEGRGGRGGAGAGKGRAGGKRKDAGLTDEEIASMDMAELVKLIDSKQLDMDRMTEAFDRVAASKARAERLQRNLCERELVALSLKEEIADGGELKAFKQACGALGRGNLSVEAYVRQQRHVLATLNKSDIGSAVSGGPSLLQAVSLPPSRPYPLSLVPSLSLFVALVFPSTQPCRALRPLLLRRAAPLSLWPFCFCTPCAALGVRVEG